jgi:nicotinamide-nucleotide amidase
VAQLVVVGDRPDDLHDALGFLAGNGASLIITTGGLGPTADDLTAEVVARFQGRPARLDEPLRVQIGGIVARLSAARGWRLDPAATAAAVDKQALVPVGSSVLPPVGTAPGLVVPVAEGRTGPPVVVLPGPPSELQPMWSTALATPIVQQALAGRTELRQRTLRLWGTPESELAATLRGLELDGLEITTCLRGGELEIVTRYAPAAEKVYNRFAADLAAAHADTLFSADGRTVEELVGDTLLERGLTIATAESCTAGLLAGRLTDRAGSSAYVLGGLVVYSNEAKRDLAGVPMELIERVGAVSAEVAEALAAGARARLDADVGVGITGIAGPGGATPGKPVGTVHFCVSTAERAISRRVQVPGDRTNVRQRSVTIALHLVRELLAD